MEQSEIIEKCLAHIKELGSIVRLLDNDNQYIEYWCQDENYTSFTEGIEKIIE